MTPGPPGARFPRTRAVARFALVCAALLSCAASEADAKRLGGTAAAAGADPRPQSSRYDETFRKYSKRYFGPSFDWRQFKAQGLTESNLASHATSEVGAFGVMQLMPSTFREVVTQNPDILRRIDDPHWNIAAGIAYDRRLWMLWQQDSVTAYRREFMFASYNAGRGTMLMAQRAAQADQLDHRSWPSIERVAPRIRRWRSRETLDYLRRIDHHMGLMDAEGRLRPASGTTGAVPRSPFESRDGTASR